MLINDEETRIQKIEIDENTNEPSIVVLKESEIPTENLKKNKKELPEVVLKHPKQIRMSEVIGFETDKSINRRKRVLKNIVTVLFIALVVAVLVYTAVNDFTSNRLPSMEVVGETLRENWYYLIFAFISVGLFFLAKGAGRSAVCRSVTGKFMPTTAFNAGVVCQFYNNITPLAMGGQPFEISYYVKKGIDGGHASSVTISTYLINMFVYATLFLLSILAYKNNWLGYAPNANGESIYSYFPSYIYIAAIIGTVISLFAPLSILVFCLFPKLGAILVNAYVWLVSKLHLTKNAKTLKVKILRSVIVNAHSMKKLFKKPATLSFATVFSIAEALANASIAYFTLRFFGFNWASDGFLEWMQVVNAVLLITAAASFNPTPGSSGAADFSFYSLFSKELLPGFAFPAMLSWRLLTFYLMILFGFVYIKTIIKKDLAHLEHVD